MVRAVDATVDAFGDLRASVASAGIVANGEVSAIKLSDWHRAFRVNVDGVFHTARAVIPSLRARGSGGAFVAVSSDAGVQGAAGWAPYVASKHAVIGLVRSMALEQRGSPGLRRDTDDRTDLRRDRRPTF